MNNPPTLPPIEEAQIDLNNIREEIRAMRMVESGAFLVTRHDVNAAGYKTILYKVKADIQSGLGVEKRILELYPSLNADALLAAREIEKGTP